MTLMTGENQTPKLSSDLYMCAMAQNSTQNKFKNVKITKASYKKNGGILEGPGLQNMIHWKTVAGHRAFAGDITSLRHDCPLLWGEGKTSELYTEASNLFLNDY